LRGFQIQKGKFKNFTIAPNMEKLVMDIRSRSVDILQFGWFNLHLDPNFEGIPNPKREI
jgi:hypothetical protein